MIIQMITLVIKAPKNQWNRPQERVGMPRVRKTWNHTRIGIGDTGHPH